MLQRVLNPVLSHMTLAAEPYDMKAMLNRIAQVVMGIWFFIRTAFLAELRSQEFSTSDCAPYRFFSQYLFSGANVTSLPVFVRWSAVFSAPQKFASAILRKCVPLYDALSVVAMVSFRRFVDAFLALIATSEQFLFGLLEFVKRFSLFASTATAKYKRFWQGVLLNRALSYGPAYVPCVRGSYYFSMEKQRQRVELDKNAAFEGAQ